MNFTDLEFRGRGPLSDQDVWCTRYAPQFCMYFAIIHCGMGQVANIHATTWSRHAGFNGVMIPNAYIFFAEADQVFILSIEINESNNSRIDRL